MLVSWRVRTYVCIIYKHMIQIGEPANTQHGNMYYIFFLEVFPPFFCSPLDLNCDGPWPARTNSSSLGLQGGEKAHIL